MSIIFFYFYGKEFREILLFHYMKQNETKKSPKVAQNRYCELCDYLTCKNADYKKHLSTVKHKKRENETFETEMKQNVAENRQCICGIYFNSRTTLWRHKKKCGMENINTTNEEICKNDICKNDTDDFKILTNLVIEVVKQNKELAIQNNELTNKIVDLCKEKNSTTILNSNINSNNKTFNLNMFLNETCKDAMNIMDFVDSLKIQLSDLENVGKLGFVEGISNIIIKNLKALDIHKRPVHCSDSKREVMYIKDEDKWEKENNEKHKLRKAIKHIANKNSKMLPEFKAKYPDCGKSDSKYVDQYNKLVIEAMGGKGENDSEKEDKIIKKIAKEVMIEKDFEKDK